MLSRRCPETKTEPDLPALKSIGLKVPLDGKVLKLDQPMWGCQKSFCLAGLLFQEALNSGANNLLAVLILIS